MTHQTPFIHELRNNGKIFIKLLYKIKYGLLDDDIIMV
jgi:hypothetical protein